MDRKILKQLKKTEVCLLQMARESVDGILLCGDLFIPEKQLSKGEAQWNDSKFQNHLGLFLCFATGNLKCVVFYALPINQSVLLVTILRSYVKEAR